MSTTVSIKEGGEAIAHRYYGGQKRGGIVKVFAKSRSKARTAWGKFPISLDGRLQPDSVTFATWLAEQKSDGYTVVFQEMSLGLRQSMV